VSPNSIDPQKGFDELVKAWKAAHTAGLLTKGQGYWHAGNTLDTYVNYLVGKPQNDANNIVGLSDPLFQTKKGTVENPEMWRDDYGWWGIAFLNAGQEEHASILKLPSATVQKCFENANFCWQVMNANWLKNNKTGVRNDPTGAGVANTITNVLFMMLSIRRSQCIGDTRARAEALDTARAVFDGFFSHHKSPGTSGLLNSQGLVRETPGSTSNRAWTGDQGWFWRACLVLFQLEDDGTTRKQNLSTVLRLITQAVFKNVFVDGVVHELPYPENYDIDYATGPGVFVRQYAAIHMIEHNVRYDLIITTAEGAWNNSDKNCGCWYAGDCKYKNLSGDPLWDLTRRTSDQDAYNALMTTRSP